MAEKNYIHIDGNGNIILQDVNGQNISINDLAAIEKAFENAQENYLIELQKQFEAQKALIQKLNSSFAENLEKAINNRLYIIAQNANTGQMGDYGHIGNNNIYSSPINELRGRIITHLKYSNLSHEIKSELEQLASQAVPQNEQLYPKLLNDFAKIEEEINKIVTQKKRQFVIWLNRNTQRQKFKEKIFAFARNKTNSPFIFAIAGKYEDKTDYASEMLQEFYFNDLLRVKENNNVLKKRSKLSISIETIKSATDAYDSLIRELLDVGIFGIDTDGLPEYLEDKYGERHINLICSVINWKVEGLSVFLDLWNKNITRKPDKPFVLILEFTEENFTELTTVFKEELSAYTLPKLEKVTAQEIIEFYKKYDFFNENALKPEDAPLFYKEAIEKLKLKY